MIKMKRANILRNKMFALTLSMGAVSIIANFAYAKPITVTAISHQGAHAHHQNANHLPYANPQAPKGGTLSLASMGTFNSMNKWIDTGIPATGTDYLYDTLLTSSLDEVFISYPQLADKITYDPDDTSWVIYHINPHAKFWDNTPVTATDVKASFDALLTKGVMSIRSYLADVKEVQVLDKHRVKFIFKSADNKEILTTVGQFPVWSKKSIDEQFGKVSLTPLMGSGPYRVGHIDAGRSITYVRDPNYWGIQKQAGVMVNQGRFNFDKIKYVYYQNAEVAFEGFKSGQYQFRQEAKARNWATAYNFPAVKAGMVIKEEVETLNPVAMQGIVMNLRRPIFADIRVRKALTYAYDFEWLNKTMMYGQYQRLQSYFYHSELEAKGKPSLQELSILQPLLPKLEPIQRQAVLSIWQAPKSGGDGFNRKNLLIARQLLREAGFYYRDMKLYQPNGQPARIRFLLKDEKMSRTILPYIRNLKKLGFDAEIQLVDAPQYIERVRKFDYDMIIDMFIQGLSPGAEQTYMWGSVAADEMGNQNTAGIKNSAIDQVINKLTNAHSREETVLYTKVLDRLLRSGYYIIPMYGSSVTRLAYWQQYQHGTLPDYAIGLEYWWVDANKEAQVRQYLSQ